jgi:hypothetical protein
MNEPCLCGDPWCPRCFPQYPDGPDPDEAHDIAEQERLDDSEEEKA